MYEDNTFRPLRFISRAEAVVTIDRALDKDVDEPSTGGGGGGGRDPKPAPVTPAAINYSFDGVNYETTTSTAITTTSSSIYVKVVTYDDETVTISHSTTSSAIITPKAIEVTTKSAIDGGVEYNAEITLEPGLESELEPGDNFIYININEKVYFIHVIKEVEIPGEVEM